MHCEESFRWNRNPRFRNIMFVPQLLCFGSNNKWLKLVYVRVKSAFLITSKLNVWSNQIDTLHGSFTIIPFPPHWVHCFSLSLATTLEEVVPPRPGVNATKQFAIPVKDATSPLYEFLSLFEPGTTPPPLIHCEPSALEITQAPVQIPYISKYEPSHCCTFLYIPQKGFVLNMDSSTNVESHTYPQMYFTGIDTHLVSFQM